MTVVSTLKQLHRHLLAHMTEARQAAYTGLLAPSRLPRHTEAEEDRSWPHNLQHLNGSLGHTRYAQAIDHGERHGLCPGDGRCRWNPINPVIGGELARTGWSPPSQQGLA